MDKIPIEKSDVVSLDHVAGGLMGLRILFVNVYAVKHGDGAWTLVDAGPPFSGGYIREWAAKHFGKHGPRSIVLTHGHFDHVGGLQDLLEHWDVPVFAHPLEMPYLTGMKQYAAPDGKAGGGVVAMLAPLYPRGPINLGVRVRPFPLEDTTPDLPEWRIIHTPGHTEGHVSFFREHDRALLAGDAFSTTKQESLIAIAKQRPELHGPPAFYTGDWDEAKESVEKLATLRPVTVAPGHGLPMAGGRVAEALKQLALNFDHVARPRHLERHEPAA